MNSYLYTLCDSNGYVLLEIRSPFTVLDYEAYYAKYIQPLLPTLTDLHGTKAYLDTRKTYTD